MSKIVATGSYLPSTIMDNNMLIKKNGIDSTNEWIEQRTGIKQRHFSNEEETVSDIATKAAENLFCQYNKDILQEVDSIIVATMSSRLPTPSVASQVQKNLGIKHSWAFDISGACSGFVMALEIAEKWSKDKASGYSLVIGAENMSEILDFSDRATSVLFGDGAGAVLLKHDGEGLPSYQSEMTSIPDPTNSIAVLPELSSDSLMAMHGREVFNFVLRNVIPSLEKFIDQKVGVFDYLLSHQANYRFLEMIAKKLNVSIDKIPSNIADVANTSAGSIPILLDQLVQDKKIKLNGTQKIVFVGYGGGLAWGQASMFI